MYFGFMNFFLNYITGGSLPKFQFAFGRGGNTNSPTTVVNTDNSATGTGNTTKSSSEIQINGNRQIQIAAPTGATTQVIKIGKIRDLFFSKNLTMYMYVYLFYFSVALFKWVEAQQKFNIMRL